MVERLNNLYKGPNQEMVRVSITIDRVTRKRIRIAAAYEDMELGDWVTRTLREAAESTIQAQDHPRDAVRDADHLAPELPEAR